MPIVDFVVKGPPFSHSGKVQGRHAQKNRDNWKRAVEEAATDVLPIDHSPIDVEASVYIAYYYRDNKKDVDNILKSTLDALGSQQTKPLVWNDDGLIWQLRVERFLLGAIDRPLIDPPIKISEALESDPQIEPVYIRVEWGLP